MNECALRGICKELVTNKAFFMGIAIILVVIYHMPVLSPFNNIIILFFIGVDFFFFFSGYSLCFSWQKHTFSDFFKRRFWRIYPMYAILAITISLLGVYNSGWKFSVIDLLCNLTTLSYYRIGGHFIDWYLSSLFIVYLLFPILYNVINKYKWMVPVFITTLVCFVITVVDIHWWYGCAIGRLPIYSLGIYCFLDDSPNKKYFLRCCLFFLLFFILSVLLYVWGTNIRGYFLTDMIAPLVLLIIATVIYMFPTIKTKKVYSIISKVGSYSLEIYVANVISMSACGIFIINRETIDMTSKILIYFVLVAIMSFGLILTNSKIKKLTEANNVNRK